MNANAEGIMNLNEQSMEEDSEMMEQTTCSNNMEENSAQNMNGEGIFNGVLNEPRTENKPTTNGVYHDHVNLPRFVFKMTRFI